MQFRHAPGRVIIFARSVDLTLRGPVIGVRSIYNPPDPTDPADYRSFTTADRFNFAPFNFILTPLERLRRFCQCQAGIRSATSI